MNFKKITIVCSALSWLMITNLHAGIPVWTFTPLTPTNIEVPASGTATIQYRITNQSRLTHTLKLRAIKGIRQITTAGSCPSPFTLGYQQSCVVSLLVTGSELNGNVIGGPVFCDQGNPLQCYLPSEASNLNIRLSRVPPVQQYTVTPQAGPNGTISPSTIQTIPPGSTVSFTASPNTGYAVMEWLVDGVVRQTGGTSFELTNINKNTIVSVSFTGLLTSSTSFLALARLDPDSGVGGLARRIIITNTSSTTINNISITYPTWPAGTVAEDNCSNLPPQQSCEITITPGEISTSDCHINATSPTPGVITVNASNGVAAPISAVVLGYSCIYQGGYLFAIDDTTPDEESIGGQVIAREDTAASLLWDTTCTDDACTETQADDLNDGLPNTINIVSILGGSSNYAAGSCNNYSAENYSDWYLPALCQLGRHPDGLCSGIPNITLNVPQIADSSCIGASCMADKEYWSSSQFDNLEAFSCIFPCIGPSASPKTSLYHTRCARNLLPN